MKTHLLASGFLCGVLSYSAFAQPADTATRDLAKKLTNPVAALISVPLQDNYDANIGVGKKGGVIT
jgi:hypothetical protein